MPQAGKSENVTWHGSKLHDPEFHSSVDNEEGSHYFEKRENTGKAAVKQARIQERNMEDWDSVAQIQQINKPTLVSAGVSASIHPS